MAVFLSSAQDDMPRFTVYAVEDTVYQGDTVHVVFTIDYKITYGFSYSSDNVRMEGATLVRPPIQNEEKLEGNWNRRIYTATFLVKGCGELATFMNVELNNEPVYSDTLLINVQLDAEYGN